MVDCEAGGQAAVQRVRDNHGSLPARHPKHPHEPLCESHVVHPTQWLGLAEARKIRYDDAATRGEL